MSGQLVGEVIVASPRLRERGLSKNGFLALIAIAEKCHAASRQGSVRWDHLCCGLFDASKRTAERAIRELKDAELIRVVKPGFNNNHGWECAPIYALEPLTDTDTTVGIAQTDTDKTATDTDKTATDTDTQHVVLDGSIDGPTDGTEPPYPPKPQRPPKKIGRDKALARLTRLNETRRSLDAYRIAEAFSRSRPTPIETGLLGDIGVQIHKCLNAGITAPAIAAGLEAWTESDSWSPTQIPRFVHKANNGQPLATSDQRVAQIQALKTKFANNRSELQ